MSNGGKLTHDDPQDTDVDFGGFSINPVTGQFVIRSPRTGDLNGHHIEWKKLNEEEMHVLCTKCEQGIAIEPNSEAVKWLHGYFYKNGCPEDGCDFEDATLSFDGTDDSIQLSGVSFRKS